MKQQNAKQLASAVSRSSKYANLDQFLSPSRLRESLRFCANLNIRISSFEQRRQGSQSRKAQQNDSILTPMRQFCLDKPRQSFAAVHRIRRFQSKLAL